MMFLFELAISAVASCFRFHDAWKPLSKGFRRISAITASDCLAANHATEERAQQNGDSRNVAVRERAGGRPHGGPPARHRKRALHGGSSPRARRACRRAALAARARRRLSASILRRPRRCRACSPILTGADVLADGLGPIPCVSRPRTASGRLQAIVEPPYHALAIDRVRCVGDAVALVVAETVSAGQGCRRAHRRRLPPLASVTDTAAAAADGAPPLWPEAPGNRSFVYEIGDSAAVDAAIRARRSRYPARPPHQPRVRQSDRAARAPSANSTPAPVATSCEPAHQTPHQLRSVLAKSVLRHARKRSFVSCPAMSGAASASKAGCSARTSWCCGRRGASAARSSGPASAPRPSSATIMPATMW